MSRKNSNRLERIDEEIKRELSHIITYEVSNSNVTGMVSVTKVHITPDLKYAKVYVSMLGSKSVEKTLEGLKSSSGFMRTKLAQSLNLRVTPELSFVYDESIEYGKNIEDKILQIHSKE